MPMAHNGLAKLAEELGELQQIVGKMLAYPDTPHPDEQGDLRTRMNEEMSDVCAAIMFVTSKLQLSRVERLARFNHKYATYLDWDETE